MNNAPCYQFGHAAKVNVRTHWSPHSSAFAAVYHAAARRLAEQRTETTPDKYADMCDKQAASMAASCSSRVMATLEVDEQDNGLRDK